MTNLGQNISTTQFIQTEYLPSKEARVPKGPDPDVHRVPMTPMLAICRERDRERERKRERGLQAPSETN